MTNPNDPAFMVIGTYPEGSKVLPTGLTKREWFAGLAMQGIISNSTLLIALAQATPNDPLKAASVTAQWASMYAEALIAELAKGEK